MAEVQRECCAPIQGVGARREADIEIDDVAILVLHPRNVVAPRAGWEGDCKGVGVDVSRKEVPLGDVARSAHIVLLHLRLNTSELQRSARGYEVTGLTSEP